MRTVGVVKASTPGQPTRYYARFGGIVPCPRARQIGIRKAIGARRRDILGQFLIEAVLVSLGGGIAGAVIGGLLATFMGGVSFGGRSLEGTLTPEPVILALAVSVAIGLVFGIYPANRAARLRPIEALRYE